MLLAADNLNPMNQAVADAMESLDPDPIKDLVNRIEQAGANLIDINPGFLSKRKEDRMTFLVETVQESTDMRLILDSPHARILKRGIEACREKPLLSALTLEQSKLEEILPLAVEHELELILLLLDDRSQAPSTMDGKLALAVELWSHATGAGLTTDKLIFDPLLPSLSWPEAIGHTGETIRTVHALVSGSILGEPARTTVGISNLLSGMTRDEKGEAAEGICLSLLAGAGLEILLANVFRKSMMQTYTIAREFMRTR